VQRSTTNATLLPFSPQHYSALTALWNLAYPELQRTELEMRLADLGQAPEAAPRRWLAELEGRAVAVGGYEHCEGELFHPRKFQLHLVVNSEYRRQGIGSALYQQVITALGSTDALAVRAWAREDRTDSVRFLVKRGFSAEMRTIHSTLDTTAFALSRLARYRQRLEKYGYEFREFAELNGDPDRNRKTHLLYCEVLSDVPSPGQRTLSTFAEYEWKINTSPELFRAHFIAIHQGQFVGLCILFPKDRGQRELYADTLGIKRAYRGRGLASALAYCGIDYAKRHAYELISADNYIENQGIMPVLNELGFANRSYWTLFSKTPGGD
jgi:GNAT superfamily N-acetyltransferase